MDLECFNQLVPSSVYFNDLIKVKPIDKFEYEYISLEKNIGYWNTSCPFENDSFLYFKKFVQSNPIWRMNNEKEFEDTNPFATIHLPSFSTASIFSLLWQFYCGIIQKEAKVNVNDWGNIYFKDHSNPIKKWRLPHMDYVSGLVANLWFTDHKNLSSGTKLYFYKGSTYGINYDFQVDENHKLYKEWHSMGPRDRDDRWKNFTDEESKYWGFELVGMAPSKYSCMTLYLPNISHTPYISDDIKFRWSHTFSCFDI